MESEHYYGTRVSLWDPGRVTEGYKITKNELFPEDGIDFSRFTVMNDYLLIFLDYMEVCL